MCELALAHINSDRVEAAYAAMDGRAYLLRHEAAFDAIVLDAYADRTAIPAHLLTREFFALARSRLSGDGTLYVNLIVAPAPDRLVTGNGRDGSTSNQHPIRLPSAHASAAHAENPGAYSSTKYAFHSCRGSPSRPAASSAASESTPRASSTACLSAATSRASAATALRSDSDVALREFSFVWISASLVRICRLKLSSASAVRAVPRGAGVPEPAAAFPPGAGGSGRPISRSRPSNPYPVYAALRARAPVLRSRLFRGWVFTRHADVSAILGDHRRFSSDPRNGSIPVLRRAMLPPPDEYTMLMLDPPDHTRVRAFSIILMMGWRHDGAKRPWASAGVGAFSGVLMASTSLGNPPVMVYLLSGPDGAATNRANFTGYFAVTLVALIALMAAAGLIDRDAVWTAALLLPIFMAGAFAGSRLFQKSSEALYRRVALALLFCVGCYDLLR